MAFHTAIICYTQDFRVYDGTSDQPKQGPFRVPPILFILFYFIRHTIILTTIIGKVEKAKWRGDLTETMGAYERLGLLNYGLELFNIN